MGGAKEKEDGAPQREGAQPFSILLHLPTSLSFSAQFVFRPSRGACPNLKNVPSVLAAAALHLAELKVLTTLQTSLRHTHPPVWSTEGGWDRVL